MPYKSYYIPVLLINASKLIVNALKIGRQQLESMQKLQHFSLRGNISTIPSFAIVVVLGLTKEQNISMLLIT